MNKENNLIFEAYKQHIINELTISGDYDNIGKAVKKGIADREGTSSNTYLFKLLKNALNKSSEEVADILTKPLYEILFPNGRFAAKGDQKDQLSKLQAAIQAKLPEIIDTLKQEYPELSHTKGISSSATHSYTARILRGFITPAIQFLEDEVDDPDEVPTENELKSAVNKAVKASVSDVTSSEDPAEDQSYNKYIEAAKDKASSAADGVVEKDLINDIAQMYVDDDPEIFRRSAVARATGLIKGLINRGILERNGDRVTIGEEADFDSDDTDAVGLDQDEYLAKYSNSGPLARSTSKRFTNANIDDYTDLD